MGKIIGIDFGTTKSCVAVFENNNALIIENEGNRTTPSVVTFLENGQTLVGNAAKGRAIRNPESTIRNIKRFMGKKFIEVKQENFNRNNSYTIIEKEDGYIYIEVLGKLYMPQQITAIILHKLKQTAEKELGEEITDAVITVPAYFNDAQRQATKEAGEIAGLKVCRIISEPTSAALAFGFKRSNNSKIAVFDLGGGTFDISILDYGQIGGKQFFHVISTNGDTHLGGNDFDKVIMDWLANAFQAEEGIDLLSNPLAWQRIKESSEKAKIELTTSIETEIIIENIIKIKGEWKHLRKTLSRAVFENLAAPTIEKCISLCKVALDEAKNKASDIDEIIMVGESCRIPQVLERVGKLFGKKPSFKVNPMEAVAIGAAIQGAILNNTEKIITLLDVTPLSLGVETGDEMTIIIPKNTRIPTDQKKDFSTIIDNQKSVEVHILQGESPKSSENKSLGMFVFDITPDKKGVPEIEIKFSIDVNGILNVTAVDKKTKVKKNKVILGGNSLSQNKLEELILEAKSRKEIDENLKYKSIRLNEVDRFIFYSEEMLKKSNENKDFNRTDFINKYLDELKIARVNEDLNSVDKAIKKLNRVFKGVFLEIPKGNIAAYQLNSMLTTLKQTLSKQFGASIQMLKNAITLCPEEYWNTNKKLFYTAYHCVLFLDYYLTIPPKNFSTPLPFTLTETENIPADAIDDLVPNRIYSQKELLDYLQAINEKCHTLIASLTEEKLAEKWIDEPDEIVGGGTIHYSVLEILLFNMRHVQHHTAQLNLLLRQGINDVADWV